MPKKKSLAIQKENLVILSGILISLLSAVIILSSGFGKPYDFLVSFILQVIGFIGFWIFLAWLFVYGIYLTFKAKLTKFKFNLTLLGAFIVFLGLMALVTFYVSKDSVEEINLKNFVDVYKNIITPAVDSRGAAYKSELGGGYVGFFLVALFNQAFTTLGTQIIGWIVVLIGVLIMFHSPIKKLFMLLKSKKGKSKEDKKDKSKKVKQVQSEDSKTNEEVKDESLQNDDVIEEKPRDIFANDLYVTQTVPKAYFDDDGANEVKEEVNETSDNDLGLNKDYAEVLERKSLSELKIKSYNRTHGLVKAHYQFGNTPSEPFNSEKEKEKVEFPKPNLNSQTIETNVQKESENVIPSSQTVMAASASNVSSSSIPTYQSESLPSKTDVVEEEKVEQVSTPTYTNTPKKPAPTFESEIEVEQQPMAKPLKPYNYPTTDLLDYHEKDSDGSANEESVAQRIKIIDDTFTNFKIGAHVAGYMIGPSVTRFDIALDPTCTVNNVQRLIDDLAIRLGGVTVRFEPLVLNKTTSGLEVQNVVRTSVGLREAIEQLPEKAKSHKLEVIFGKNISGELIHADLAKFPHLLVAGATGSGKSIFMRSVITTFIMANRPEELRLLLIDPKMVEMACFQNIPHLLCPTITDANKGKVALEKLAEEMQRRYRLFATNYCDSIDSFNKKAQYEGREILPRIVVCVDEYADLQQTCKEVEAPILRIAQKARAAGIHLIIATQRPTVDIINGTIKANFASRVALMVSNVNDSQVIIGEKGAETLLGNGDMLVESPLISRTSKIRVQGTFIDLPEVLKVCNFITEQTSVEYDPNFMDLSDHKANMEFVSDTPINAVSNKDVQEEELYEMIKEDVMKRETCSISFIQRTYGVGFPKAGRLFAKLQKDGIVSSVASKSARGCEVLIHESINNEVNNLGSVEQSEIIDINNDDDNFNDEGGE